MCVLIAMSACTTVDTESVVIQFDNGQWYDGNTFISETVYTVDDLLTRERPARVDSVVELAGSFVIPPLAEAHTHELADSDKLSEESQRFLSHGVFYAMNQDPIHAVTSDVRSQVNHPQGVDVVYTQGVATPSYGVIAEMYSMLASMGAFGTDKTLYDLDSDVIFLIDSRDDLVNKWDSLAARNSDFIKVILAFSEEHEMRRDNIEKYGVNLMQEPRWSARPGLDPALLPELVTRAHAADVRVSVHIETAADFRVALDAGADLIAHVPGSWQIGTSTGFTNPGYSPWLLDEADAMRAAEAGTIVITTTHVPPGHPDSLAFAQVHRHNLDLLAKHDVHLALGSDNFGDTILSEAGYIASLGIIDNATLLKILVQDTPAAIFPDRSIGSLSDGYEASFLILDANPIDDINNLSTIRGAMKQGVFLDISAGQEVQTIGD